MRFVKPLDAGLVEQLAREHELLVTLEEGAVMGGAGSAVAECLAAAGLARPLLHLGLPDKFIDHGDAGLQLAAVGLDQAGVLSAIRTRLGA
jgi:1-deoxy-D-xylulose-5-phosphate synthase